MGAAFKKLCRIAGETVVCYRLIAEGDRILVAVSGGKDSLTLMHLLTHFQKVAPVRFTVTGATFDPGFPEFHLDALRDYAASQNWHHEVVTLPVAEILREKKWEQSPCVLCSRLRRGKLYSLAKEKQCGKLALGQHLDDVNISFLMSLFHGQGLTTMAPLVHPDDPASPAVIRPMALVPEALVREAAAEFAFPAAGECSYRTQLQEEGDRAYFQRLLQQISRRIPDVRENMAHSLTRVETGHLLIPPPPENKP